MYRYNIILSGTDLYSFELGKIKLIQSDVIALYKSTNLVFIEKENEYMAVTFSSYNHTLHYITSFDCGVMESKKGIICRSLNTKLNIISIHCGFDHAIAKTADGIYGFGCNNHNELSNDDMEFKTFTKINFDGVIEVFCGYYCTFITTANGLYACGCNVFNRLGYTGDSSRLRKTDLDCKIITIASSRVYNYFLTEDGLFTCGEEGFMVKVDFDHDIKSIYCEEDYDCILCDDGLYFKGTYKKYCTKSNWLYFDINEVKFKEFTKIEFDHEIISVITNCDNMILETYDGFYGRGKNSHGQLGLDHRNPVNEFTRIPFDKPIDRFQTKSARKV